VPGDIWYEPGSTVELRLRLRGDPVRTISGRPASWNLVASEAGWGDGFFRVGKAAVQLAGGDLPNLQAPWARPVREAYALAASARWAVRAACAEPRAWLRRARAILRLPAGTVGSTRADRPGGSRMPGPPVMARRAGADRG